MHSVQKTYYAMRSLGMDLKIFETPNQDRVYAISAKARLPLIKRSSIELVLSHTFTCTKTSPEPGDEF